MLGDAGVGRGTVMMRGKGRTQVSRYLRACRLATCSAFRPVDDSGLSIIEVVAAILVITLVLLPATLLVNSSIIGANTQRLRVEAQNLATSSLEQIQAEASNGPLPGGTTTTTVPVNGTTFTVKTTFAIVSQGGGQYTSICQAGSQNLLQVWQVTAVVSWQGMNGAQPISQTTDVAPGQVGAVQLQNGEIAISVDNTQGQPLIAAPIYFVATPVRVAGSGALPSTESGNTGTSGCGVISGLTTDPNIAWTVTLTPNPGWVSSLEASDTAPASPPTSSSITVAAGQVTYVSPAFQLGTGVLTNVTLQTIKEDGTGTCVMSNGTLPPASCDDPAVPVASVPVSVGNGALPNNGQFTFGTGTTQVSSMLLYPYSSGYSVWAGDMPESNPGFIQTGATQQLYPGDSAVTLPIGTSTTASVTIPVYPLTLKVSSPVGGAALNAVEVDGGRYSFPLNALNSSSISSSGLPLGQYEVTASGASLSAPLFVWITPTGVCQSATQMTTCPGGGGTTTISVSE